jgi:hypothetical protein
VEVATIESVMAGARKYMRDFPRYFTASVGVVGVPRLLKLPHPNVAPQELYVEAIGPTTQHLGRLAMANSTSAEGVFTYTLDVREGLIKILAAPTNGWGDATNFNMDGYYFPWVSPGDMQFYAEVLITEHGTQRPDFDLDEVSDAEEDLMQLGTAIEACWALLFQYSRDIDVSTPEAIGLPLTQRFRQLEDLLMHLSEKYKTKANMLGVGLERVTVGMLRRTSYTTNRLVPVYQPREWDDGSPPKRLFPPIDQNAPSTPPPGFQPAAVVTGYYEEIHAYTGEG